MDEIVSVKKEGESITDYGLRLVQLTKEICKRTSKDTTLIYADYFHSFKHRNNFVRLSESAIDRAEVK